MIAKLKWAKKAEQSKIRQLYHSNAKMLEDPELADDVGISLYVRCESIIAVTNAYEKKHLECPYCGTVMVFGVDKSWTCKCGLTISWNEFRKSYKDKQLYAANALPVFLRFVEDFPKQKTCAEKIIVIDQLIHAFHILHSFRKNSFTFEPNGSHVLGRPTAANLIEGSLYEVIAFLDTLSAAG